MPGADVAVRPSARLRALGAGVTDSGYMAQGEAPDAVSAKRSTAQRGLARPSPDDPLLGRAQGKRSRRGLQRVVRREKRTSRWLVKPKSNCPFAACARLALVGQGADMRGFDGLFFFRSSELFERPTVTMAEHVKSLAGGGLR